MTFIFEDYYRKHFSIKGLKSYDIPFYEDWNSYSFGAQTREENFYNSHKMLKYLLRQLFEENEELLLLSTQQFTVRGGYDIPYSLSDIIPKRDIKVSPLFNIILPDKPKLLSSFLLDENSGKYFDIAFVRHLYRVKCHYSILDKLSKSIVCGSFSGDIPRAKNLKLEMLALYSPDKNILVELYDNLFVRIFLEDEKLKNQLNKRFILLDSSTVDENFTGVVNQPYHDW